MVLFRLCKTHVKCDFFSTKTDERCQSYLATTEPRFRNLENSNKLVLDKIKNSISSTAFNAFAEKNNTRLDAFEEGLLEIEDDLESLKEKRISTSNTILTDPVLTQINYTTPPTHSDNPKVSTLASQISRSINERVERANNIVVFDFQEQSNESDKITIINLYKSIVDREVSCKSTRLSKKDEGKIRPLKIVFLDAIVKSSFMKNLNKLKNPPDQFKNLRIKHDMSVDKWKNEKLLQDIANEKNNSKHGLPSAIILILQNSRSSVHVLLQIVPTLFVY